MITIPQQKVCWNFILEKIQSSIKYYDIKKTVVPIISINQAIIENPVNFMDPQTCQLINISEMSSRHHKHPIYNSGKVSQVEHIMTFSGCR